MLLATLLHSIDPKIVVVLSRGKVEFDPSWDSMKHFMHFPQTTTKLLGGKNMAITSWYNGLSHGIGVKKERNTL